MDVSIIIVNYHSADLVVECINSIYQKTENIIYEIIVVDNASEDDSVEKLSLIYGNKIKLIVSEENLGFGKANNLGARYAKGKYLFMLNPDTILVNNAIKILYDYLEKNPKIGIAGGNLYMPEMTASPSYCLQFDTVEEEKKNASWIYLIKKKFQDKLALQGKVRPFETTFNYSNEVKEVAYIFGADIMISKCLFDSIKGFDPDFFMYAEEEELSWRVTKKGYQIVNVPQAKIIHLEGATSKKRNDFSEKQFKMRMHGTLTYYKKCYGTEGLKQFYKYRMRRYERLILFAKLRGKDTNDMLPQVQLKCLEACYLRMLEEKKETGTP